MKKRFYPAIFQREEIGYSVWLADVPGCISQGDTLEEAYENIKSAFGLFVEEEKETGISLPSPTTPEQVKVLEGQFVALIEFDWLEYLKENDTQPVEKTLTIPAWLNIAAEDAHINFSKLLQQALKDTLNV